MSQQLTHKANLEATQKVNQDAITALGNLHLLLQDAHTLRCGHQLKSFIQQAKTSDRKA
jgi:hypothetical protein